MIYIHPDNPNIDYCGRIDFEDPKAPVLIWAASYVHIRFTGENITVRLQNHHDLWTNSMGYILDGKEGKINLFAGQNTFAGTPQDMEAVWEDSPQDYIIHLHNSNSVHDLILFKRQDSCHYVTFLGFGIVGGDILPIDKNDIASRLRLEVYGDSVSNGEVSEAAGYEGKVDPENHFAKYNNVYHSYSWILARKLNARLHDVSQGGIALMDDTGYFHPRKLVGMINTWDKLRYNPNPDMGAMSDWDFSRYTPDIVIIAIGQNDAHPFDFMKEAPDSVLAGEWISNYVNLIQNIRKKYPKASIICLTTILIHDEAWDKAIEKACNTVSSAGDDNIYHFLFTNNGRQTPGHIRKSEAEVMADELYAFINSVILNN